MNENESKCIKFEEKLHLITKVKGDISNGR